MSSHSASMASMASTAKGPSRAELGEKIAEETERRLKADRLRKEKLADLQRQMEELDASSDGAPAPCVPEYEPTIVSTPPESVALAHRGQDGSADCGGEFKLASV